MTRLDFYKAFIGELVMKASVPIGTIKYRPIEDCALFR
jgi:hypothetical protein